MKIFAVLCFLAVAPLAGAEAPADTLDRAVQSLESLEADWQTIGAETADLRQHLADLEALAQAHEKSLAAYSETVAQLEAHDQASLALAQDLRRQLNLERQWAGWLAPTAVGLGLVVVAETAWLLVRR